MNKNELIQELLYISKLWKRALSIRNRMENFSPDDNYERKVVLPHFPAAGKLDWIKNVDHKADNATEKMCTLYEDEYKPHKPVKQDIGEFKAPDATRDETDKSSKYGCLGTAGIIIAGFFGLGYLTTLIGNDYPDTLPTIMTIAIIGVVLFVFSKIQIHNIKAVQSKRTDEALAWYNKEKDDADAKYSLELNDYEEALESYKSNLEVFLKEYEEWRKIYLQKVKEETIISDKLEQDRLAAVQKIEEEELTPILTELAEINMVPSSYLSELDTIIDLLEKGRADDLKEAINLYEDILYRERQLQLQREQEAHRQYEEALRRQEEERRHREEMNFLEDQERQRQREEVQRQRDAEFRHREEMNQRAQRERDEQRQLVQMQEAARRRCRNCISYHQCSMSVQSSTINSGTICSSYRPK